MKSIGQMLTTITGLLGTKDINNWEERFISSMSNKVAKSNGSTSQLSENEVEKIDEIYHKHFAGGYEK